MTEKGLPCTCLAGVKSRLAGTGTGPGLEMDVHASFAGLCLWRSFAEAGWWCWSAIETARMRNFAGSRAWFGWRWRQRLNSFEGVVSVPVRAPARILRMCIRLCRDPVPSTAASPVLPGVHRGSVIVDLNLSPPPPPDQRSPAQLYALLVDMVPMRAEFRFLCREALDTRARARTHTHTHTHTLSLLICSKRLWNDKISTAAVSRLAECAFAHRMRRLGRGD